MELKTGEIIKSLRKKQDITQEKLAEYLGISYQAISKWENGTSLPDVTIFPALANFFGIRTDDLFGISPQQADQKIKEFEAEYTRLHSIGDVGGMIAIMRQALAEYPRHYRFMLHLANALSSLNGFHAVKGLDLESIQEAVRLCERILEDCTEEGTRQQAFKMACTLYPKIGMLEEARRLAESMPELELCKELILENLQEGDAQIKQTQENVLRFVDLASSSLIRLAFDKHMGKDLTYQQKIQYVEASSQMLKTLLSDGNYVYYHGHLSWNERRLAELWCAVGKADRTMQCLENAAHHAESFDALPETARYSAPFVNHCTYSRSEKRKTWMGTECGMLYYRMSEAVFDGVRELPAFKALHERLAKSKLDSVRFFG